MTDLTQRSIQLPPAPLFATPKRSVSRAQSETKSLISVRLSEDIAKGFLRDKEIAAVAFGKSHSSRTLRT